MAGFNLDDYMTVPERIQAFRDAYPEGTLRPADPSQPFTILTVGGQTFLAYTAAAYRTPDDLAPGIGCAWEPVPGATSYTKNSELQNAETSAWGRAIIAVGAADAKKGVASQEDVRNRHEEQTAPLEDPTVGGMRTALQAAIDKWVGDPRDEDRASRLAAFFAENDLPAVKRMSSQAQCDLVIGFLMDQPDEEES